MKALGIILLTFVSLFILGSYVFASPRCTNPNYQEKLQRMTTLRLIPQYFETSHTLGNKPEVECEMSYTNRSTFAGWDYTTFGKALSQIIDYELTKNQK